MTAITLNDKVGIQKWKLRSLWISGTSKSHSMQQLKKKQWTYIEDQFKRQIFVNGPCEIRLPIPKLNKSLSSITYEITPSKYNKTKNYGTGSLFYMLWMNKGRLVESLIDRVELGS